MVKQWNVVARREPPIGNGAVAAKIDTDNLPNSLCRLFDAAEELHDGRYGFAGARPHHRYGFAVVECLDGFAFRLLRSEEHTSELQSLMRISYAVFCLKKKTKT